MEFTGKWQGSPSGNCGKSDGNPKEMTRSSSGKLWGIWWNFKEMVGCSRGVYGGNQRKMVVGAPGGVEVFYCHRLTSKTKDPPYGNSQFLKTGFCPSFCRELAGSITHLRVWAPGSQPNGFFRQRGGFASPSGTNRRPNHI
jgi:hypothetical protein